MAAAVSSKLQFVNKGINVHSMLLNSSPHLSINNVPKGIVDFKVSFCYPSLSHVLMPSC